MNFSINLGAWNAVFAVPTQLVDQHLKLAGGVHLKVLLWLLRYAGRQVDIQEISRALGVAAADIKDAVQYWVSAGLIADFSCEDSSVVIAPAAQTPALPVIEHTVEVLAAPKQESPQIAEKPKKAPARMKKPDGLYIAERVTQSEQVAFLMQEAQQILGRAISPALSSALLMIHDDYGLPVEVILILLTYVKSIHKDNTGYIEAVARNWAQEEINTHEKADLKLNRLSAVAQAWRNIEKALGIDHRSPSAKEEQYTERWILQWNFTPQMVRLAYERCVDSTGKLSLHYMNKILERWHHAGITSPNQAAAELTAKSQKNVKKRAPTYDLEEYENTDLSEFM